VPYKGETPKERKPRKSKESGGGAKTASTSKAENQQTASQKDRKRPKKTGIAQTEKNR